VFELFCQITQRFDEPVAEECINMIIAELGGIRVTVPSQEHIYRQDRNLKIRKLFNGANISELALRFELSVTQIRRIVNRG
jgi:Mor family transcriptional regulator